MPESDGSITQWISSLKAGDGAAANKICERYLDRLARLVRARLRTMPAADHDEEDVALSAFHTLCAGASKGAFPDLINRNDLWRLLVTIALRKAYNQIRNSQAQKRGGRRGEDALRPDLATFANNLDQFAGREPAPDVLAIVAEECRRLLEGLPNESLRQVAELRVEGYTGTEIADRLGCSRRTVMRKLELIRTLWGGDQAS